MDAPLRLGFSPCPNDTFVFHALVHGAVAPELRWQVRLEDVETLNALAERGALDVAKVSYHAFGRIADDWWMLPSGGALGRGVGPLVVARDPGRSLHGARIATPGGRTTASLLLDLYAPKDAERVVMRYDAILAAVADGSVDAGLIIHESRFTYAGHGLSSLVDLGAWWEERYDAPIPLGGIAVRRTLAPELIGAVGSAVRASVEAAQADPAASTEYVAAHAQEMSPSVRDRHIATYVGAFTLDLGAEGRAAVRTLFDAAAQRGLMAPVRDDLFWNAG